MKPRSGGGAGLAATCAMLLSMAPCPICGKPSRPRTENRAFPFCSPRCRQVDLGQWLDEKYRVPVTDVSAEDGESLLDQENA